jgi:transcriptional regulator with XRE-family HTH domain
MVAGTEAELLCALGQTIKEIRERHATSTDDLAAKLGARPAWLERVEAGQVNLGYRGLRTIASALGVPTSVLLRRSEERASTLAVNHAFAARLRELRLERGISQERLADATGVHRATIYKIEQGSRAPQLVTLMQLARGLDVPPETLVKDLATERS